MYYSYILLSSKSHIFYFGSTKDLKLRFKLHNEGKVKSTKSHISKIESGERRLDVAEMKKFAAIYKKDTNYFLK